MSEWLRFSKLGEYYVDYRFDEVKEAERQLHLAVIRGEVRARCKGECSGQNG